MTVFSNKKEYYHINWHFNLHGPNRRMVVMDPIATGRFPDDRISRRAIISFGDMLKTPRTLYVAIVPGLAVKSNYEPL